MGQWTLKWIKNKDDNHCNKSITQNLRQTKFRHEEELHHRINIREIPYFDYRELDKETKYTTKQHNFIENWWNKSLLTAEEVLHHRINVQDIGIETREFDQETKSATKQQTFIENWSNKLLATAMTWVILTDELVLNIVNCQCIHCHTCPGNFNEKSIF